MTVKYESEILFDLMKRDGDDAPSDVLPYESELKEKYLNQVVGAYPKLQDYRPEWLNYNLYHRLPSDFPVESVANVTSASFNNVVPYAYGGAILKGQTLVNISTQKSSSTFTFQSAYNGATPNRQAMAVAPSNGSVLTKPSSRYIIKFTVSNYINNYGGSVPITILDYDIHSVVNSVQVNGNGNYYIIGTTKETLGQEGRILIKSNATLFENNTQTEVSLTISNIMVLEYQDGMENWDIPYFTGMQSVQMPVLKTSNEDGTKTNILTVNEDVTLRGIGDVKDELDCLTGEVTERIRKIVLDGSQYMASDGYGVYIQVNDVKRFLDYTDKIACDKLPVIPTYQELENVENGISGFTNSGSYPGQNWLYIKVNNSIDVGEVRQILTQKPIIVQYQLAQESIKTVDLTVTDQDGNTESIIRPIEGTMHVSTSSQTLPSLLDMSVPVEAITQNLMSFANIEAEE